MIHPTPALVTAAAIRRLPRWVPWLIVAAFVLPGFVGRDPWRPDDLAAFAVMLDMRGGGSWLSPEVLGETAGPLAWLPYWVGAAALALAPPLPAELAVRLPFIALLGLTLASTWYATYRLARLPAAQPIDLAFGDRISPTDYARALADAALLALVATLGLALRAHEATPAAAQLAFAALLFHTAARGLTPAAAGNARLLLPWWGAAWGLALSGAPLLGAALAAAALAWWWPYQPRRMRLGAALGSISALAASVGLAWLAGRAPELWDIRLARWTTLEGWHSFVRLLAWFVWPSAALALWALWRWRARWREPHIGWPLTCVVVTGAATVLDGGDDRTLLLALPALAALAAFALPTLRRGVAAAIDWFALLFFSGAAIVIWVIWVAMQTGVPPKPAANVARLVPGFEPAFDAWLFTPAALASIAWLLIVAWRLGRHTPALWKGLVLSASGLTLNWLLLMTLWLPLLNYGMGQAPISRRVAAMVPPGACVAVFGLDGARIAGLQHHGGLTVRRVGARGQTDCPILVLAPAAYPVASPWLQSGRWRLRSEIPRLRENRERWLVFERAD
ncbi:hypothetical protein [Tepidimonas charontis]|uniref:4-amino-4-deoxy-L-arabinose transferase n=1 Tax=Tepidimonas charontis TaxID=2267262 RepID=A0A554XGV1_9BURK|nr:hypothetical protein [Tepidimonas charontis]TSE35054.1 hypothetical protein Tchar_00985 [Tepidimonas charontis]